MSVENACTILSPSSRFEPEWFDGVEGNFGYWTGGAGTCNAGCNHTGKWGIAGPGVSAEMSAGGELTRAVLPYALRPFCESR